MKKLVIVLVFGLLVYQTTSAGEIVLDKKTVSKSFSKNGLFGKNKINPLGLFHIQAPPSIANLRVPGPRPPVPVTWETFSTVVLDESGVRSWNLVPSSGNLNISSGDGSGIINFNRPVTGASAQFTSGSFSGTLTATGVIGTSAGIFLDQIGTRSWSIIPGSGNLSLASGDGLGNINISRPLIGASAQFTSGSYSGTLTATGVIGTSAGIALDQQGTRSWSITPTDGNLSFTSGDGLGSFNMNGSIRSKKVTVTQLGWSDYVFYDDYRLMPLSEVERFIKQNKHLPEVPSAKKVEEQGINLGDLFSLYYYLTLECL
jgi:hypothetical protein